MKKKEKSSDTIGFILVRVPIEMHRDFKKFCLKNRISMQEILKEYIVDLLEPEE